MESIIWLYLAIALSLLIVLLFSIAWKLLGEGYIISRFRKEMVFDYYIRPQLVWFYLENPMWGDEESADCQSVETKIELYGKNSSCFFDILDHFDDTIHSLYSYPRPSGYYFWKKAFKKVVVEQALNDPQRVKGFLEIPDD